MRLLYLALSTFALAGAACGRIDYDPSSQADGLRVDAASSLADAAAADAVNTAFSCGTAGGTLDDSFGVSGRQTLVLGLGNSQPFALLASPSGQLYASGHTRLGANTLVAVRLSADGLLDTIYGDGGVAIVPQFNNDFGYSSALQPDGKLLIAGDTWNGGRADDYMTVRLLRDGSLDTDFGVNGYSLVHFTGGDSGRTLSLRDSGEILLAGIAGYTTTNSDFGIAQLDMNGTLDSSFGTNGLAMSDFGIGMDEVGRSSRASHLLPDGTLVVGGIALTGTEQDFALVKHTKVGALDTSFGMAGRVVTDLGGVDLATTLVGLANGKFVLAGSSTIAADSRLALARYLPNGSLDSSFGEGGIVTTSLLGGEARIHALVEAADGSLIVAGHTIGTTSSDLLLARYCPDGTLDLMFGDNGFVIDDIHGEADIARALVLQGNRVVVLADSKIGEISHFVLSRYQL